MTDRLRPHWDFGDLDATEERFRSLLATEATASGRAEVLTQLARIEGLRENFDAGERLVDEAARTASAAVAAIRVDLERGRLRRSSGDKEAALPLFESAFWRALDADEDWLAADAAHMCALAAPSKNAFVAWTNRGIELAEASEAAAYWLGPLLNNLGWEHFDAGEHEQALAAFERALAAREREPEKVAEIEAARQAVAEARNALGRDR
ncbi:MAG TPA: tetratricopeptide repeat protein [Gaiellaceae bacterium]|nr:tetratricopeptide repeat protein [Gaiellaceae bacterium]